MLFMIQRQIYRLAQYRGVFLFLVHLTMLYLIICPILQQNGRSVRTR